MWVNLNEHWLYKTIIFYGVKKYIELKCMTILVQKEMELKCSKIQKVI